MPLGISHNHYIDLFFALVGLYTILRIKGLKNNKKLMYILWISISLVLTSIFLDFVIHLHTPLIYFGAVGLIIGHSLNFLRYKKL